MMTQLNLSFNANAVKVINEVCKCDPLEGVNMMSDELISDDKNNKYKQ